MNHSIEDKINNLTKNMVDSLGFEIVKISLQGSNANILEILIERKDGAKVSVGDCRLVSRNISMLIEVEDVITNKYYLEVSSCGIERPLIKFEDYTKFLNSEVKIKLLTPVGNRLKYQGVIVETQNNSIKLRVGQEIMSINFKDIKGGHIVMTDEMFRKLLNQSK
ncbi:MAG: ribosome maturation factor RimP [Rickettsiaceae bacterium]|nr:MAG: ribosome maturation factor RimP [Rickettsiaceae bacterium]